MRLRVICLLPLFAAVVFAQQPPSTAAAQKQAMQACSFLTGQWSGQGSIAMGPQERRTFTESETVQPKLDGLLLEIEGKGTSDSGGVVHSAFAVLSFDGDSKQYHFRAYEGSGHFVDAAADCKDGAMAWSMSFGPRQMRYHISLNEKGQWHETGEISMDGQSWHPFFEMTLDKAH